MQMKAEVNVQRGVGSLALSESEPSRSLSLSLRHFALNSPASAVIFAQNNPAKLAPSSL